MSRLEVLLRLSLLRSELVTVAAATDDDELRELIRYAARALLRARDRGDADEG